MKILGALKSKWEEKKPVVIALVLGLVVGPFISNMTSTTLEAQEASLPEATRELLLECNESAKKQQDLKDSDRFCKCFVGNVASLSSPEKLMLAKAFREDESDPVFDPRMHVIVMNSYGICMKQ